MSREDRSFEGFTRWDLFHSRIAVFMTFSIYKTRLSPCGGGKLLLLLFLLLFISEIVLKTWNVDIVRNPLLFSNFDIRFPFGVFIPEKINCII